VRPQDWIIIFALAGACAEDEGGGGNGPGAPDTGSVEEDAGADSGEGSARTGAFDEGEPFEADVEPLIAPPTVVHFAARLPGGRLLVDTDTALIVGPGDATEPVDGVSGRVAAVAHVGGGTVLVATDEGLFALDDGVAVRSPLGDALAGATVRGLVSAPGPDGTDVWIATDAALHLWRGGVIHAVRPEGLPVEAALIAAGPSPEGLAALWVAAAGTVYALRVGADGAQAWPELAGVEARALAVDARGTVLVVEAGHLWVRDPVGGAWARVVPPAPVMDCVASIASPSAWLHLTDGLWHLRDGELRAALGAPSGGSLWIDADGSALLAGAGLVRVRLERQVRLAGLEDGATLAGPTVVTIEPDRPQRVREVRAGLSADRVEQAVIEGPPWSLELDPTVLEPGEYTLGVTIEYDDGPTTSAGWSFAVRDEGAPTWAEDVQPIFRARCEVCHGENGFARRLDELEVWREQIELILAALREERMPLPPNPPLEQVLIDRIAAWGDAGFPE
jgi:hypothetical protein